MKFMVPCLLLVANQAAAQQTRAAQLMSRDLTDIPGKEATMVVVELAPGAAGDAHRHYAHVFVYVLEGLVVMQVEGGKEVTLGPGQTFYETPEDIHTVSRNASMSAPAKFLAFLVKNKGAPTTVPGR